MKLFQKPICFSALLMIWMLVSGGCAAQPKVAGASPWPATFSDRKFFFRHGVVIYARDSFTAEISARHITDLGREFTRNTGRQPMNGLVIVNAVADTRIGNLDLEKLMPDERREPQLIELGFTMQEFVLAMGLPLHKEQFDREPGFSPAAIQTVQWAASIPDQKRIDKFGDHLLDAGLKKQNFNFFQRMLIMPFLPLIHGLINDAMSAERDTAIYGCFCDAQTGWSDDRKKQEASAYAEKRMGAVVKSLKATTQQIKGGGDE